MNLSAGTYPVTVTDANGCTAADSVFADSNRKLGIMIEGGDMSYRHTVNSFIGIPTSTRWYRYLLLQYNHSRWRKLDFLSFIHSPP